MNKLKVCKLTSVFKTKTKYRCCSAGQSRVQYSTGGPT